MQWAQLDVAWAGGTLDPSWVTRTSEAVVGYADDRDAAVAELEAVLAEMHAVLAGTTPPSTGALDPGTDTTGLRDCMVEVARLIVEANVSAGFDPTRVDEWQARADEVETLVDDGELSTAEALVCELRDEIDAAIDDPSLVPG